METPPSIPQQVLEAAMSGELDQMPKEWLTQENVTWLNDQGMTLLHWAAASGSLDQLPPHLLTQENLTLTSATRPVSPLAFAAMMRNLHQVPKQLLTQENFTQGPRNPLKMIALSSSFEQVPLSILVSCRSFVLFEDGTTVFDWLSPELKAAVESDLARSNATESRQG
jgi:hypothetical protein